MDSKECIEVGDERKCMRGTQSHSFLPLPLATGFTPSIFSKYSITEASVGSPGGGTRSGNEISCASPRMTFTVSR